VRSHQDDDRKGVERQYFSQSLQAFGSVTDAGGEVHVQQQHIKSITAHKFSEAGRVVEGQDRSKMATEQESRRTQDVLVIIDDQDPRVSWGVRHRSVRIRTSVRTYVRQRTPAG
jgi:hypothetical protein